MSAPDKGKFSTEISDDVLRDAVESVERHQGHAPVSTQDEVVPVEVEATAPEPSPPAEAVAEVAAQEDDAAAGDIAAAEKELEILRSQLELSQAKGREMMEKLKDAHERMLRAVADLENFKKRAAKEKEEIQRFGAEKLLRDFLPVIDNLDRALDHAKQSTDYESLRTGVAMTRKQFEDALGRNGVKGFSSAGQPFDPRVHEAMQQVETAEVPPNHVVSELVRGYMLNDRLIRPALVSVSVAPAPAAAPQSSEAAPASDAGEGGGSGQSEPGGQSQ